MLQIYVSRKKLNWHLLDYAFNNVSFASEGGLAPRKIADDP